MSVAASGGEKLSAESFRRLPKVDLHLHLEGSLTASFLGRLARQRGEPAPDLGFRDFAGFLKAFGRACDQLRGPADVARAVVEMGTRLQRDGVVHAEVFVSPAVHRRRGMGWACLADGLEHGAAVVTAAGGPRLLFVADGVRQWGVAPFRSMLAEVARRPSPLLAAVGLGGDETAVPARRFAAAFAAARDLGLPAVVHAGEIGSAAGVAEALNSLRPRRIGHGIAAAGSREVMGLLRRRGVMLDVCLTSNRRTGAVSGGRRHPLPALLAAGLPVSLGSDDPALFRTTLSAEFSRAARLGLTRTDLSNLAVAGARGSLLPPAERRRLTTRLRSAWAAWGRQGGRS
jgi:adenosine deaminase